MRRAFFALAALAVVAPLGAQQQQGSALPAGWSSRFDNAGGSAKFVVMGPGFHVTSGGDGAAIYYSAKDVGTGVYSATAKFSQSKPSGHEGYGVFIGGSNLQDASQSYIYFLVRPADGYYLINHRAGTAVHKIVDWTASPAMNKQDASGAAKNDLTIHVAKDSVHFIANGKLVKGFSKADLKGFNVGGQAGLRVNHMLDLHIAEFSVKNEK